MSSGTPGASLLERLVLNEVQTKAVLHDSGAQLVFAGAGTGKTRVLTAKIAWLIEQRGLPPSSIFAATFTNKAAREMKSRVASITGLSCDGLWIGTFHSMCARILRREATHLGYLPSFTIYDDDDQATVIRRLLKELGIEERAMTLGAARSAISLWKNDGVEPQAALAKATGYQHQQAARLYAAYQSALRTLQAMDFDDLLGNVVKLFHEHPGVLGRYRSMFRHVLVDEYQDTNRTQFHLVHLLASEHGRIFVVGDDDQSIYGWRGAQVDNILSFERHFPGTTVFKLEQNYRSTKPILDFANAAIIANSARAEKRLWTTQQSGAAVTVTCYGEDRREADGVARLIRQQITGGSKPSEIMILFRTNAQSRPFEDVLRRERIAYTLVGGLSFYQRKEIKDCVAYLRLLVNPNDDVSFERIMNVPPRGLGPKAREDLGTAASGPLLPAVMRPLDPSSAPVLKQKGVVELRTIFTTLSQLRDSGSPIEQLLRQALKLSGYMTMLENEQSEEAEGRVENINEMFNAIAEWEEDHEGAGLTEFLEEVALVSDIDMAADDSQRVTLMTLHAAKGLEALHVFLTGLEDGLLPSRMNFEDDAKIEEERRLFYVGITRAQRTLHCSYATQRWRFGSVTPMTPSRFLESIPESLYRLEHDVPRYDRVAVPPTSARVVSTRAGQMQRPPQRDVAPARSQEQFEHFSQEEVQLRMGQRVRHKQYGIGRILNISGFNDDMRVTVLFDDGERRRMLARFAALEAL